MIDDSVNHFQDNNFHKDYYYNPNQSDGTQFSCNPSLLACYFHNSACIPSIFLRNSFGFTSLHDVAIKSCLNLTSMPVS